MNCNGAGTKIDPIQIDNTLPIPKRVTFRNSKYQVLIKNIKSKKLGIDICEDITFENCIFDLVRLPSSANIQFRNSIINRDIRLKECDGIIFEHCIIKNSIFYRSDNNIIKESFFISLRDWQSKTYSFENNKIKSLETNVKEANFHKKNILINNEIKKTKYKLKTLFQIGPKVLLKDPKSWFSCFFMIIFLVMIFTLSNLRSQGYSIGLWSVLIQLIFPAFILILILSVYIPEYYYKIKLRILSKKYFI